MVRIEKLTMKGFKSFANKTVIPFPTGFNVVCGPNGSGKSNIADAISFVLGILSKKTIRAGKMQDLIFAGTKNKEPAKNAYIIMHLDNSGGEIEGEGEKIQVMRKINREGNSLYKLNGKTVTRRRIVDVLANADIFADGHNILMQGEITKLIEMNPKQRREIIDEISGIAEFEDKKEKAEKELEKVDNKLKEANIILAEKRDQLKKLEKEKENAEEYRKLEKDLHKFRGSILKKRLDNAQARYDNIKAKVDEEKEKWNKIEQEFGQAEENLKEIQKNSEEITNQIFEKGKDRETGKRIQELEIKKTKKEDKIESNRREIERLDDMINNLQELNSGFGGSVKEVMNLNKPGVFGTLGSLSKVREKYQNALEVALGSKINNIIVDNDNIAKECINFLKKEKIGRATFLPLNKLRFKDKSKKAKDLKNKPGVIDFALNLIDYDKKYDIAFRHALFDTLVVKDIDTARKNIGKAKFVTLDGDLVQKSGAMLGGFYKKKKKEDKTGNYKSMKKEIEKENDELKQELEKIKSELDMLKQSHEEESGKVSKLEQERKEKENKLKEIRGRREELYEKRLNIQTKLNNLKVKRAKIEAELDNINTTFDEYKDIENFFDKNIETLESEKKNVLQKLNRIGEVNQKAIEEHNSMKVVYDDLKKKVEKIQEEKDRVIDMAEKVERNRKETFMDTFNKVKRNFEKIFRSLFNSKGTLELEEKDNIKSGLIIKANLEGKKNLSIDSMSGGEKTLTALAFLFSVQQYKPAPFYIWDEIDAALDKRNSKKISKLIEEYSKTAQFIIITHNDNTIKMGDKVYGVTKENGTSKVMGIEMPAGV